ncbi:bifunctional apoptosis regulator-like isoform X1 [Apteryx mantelli]|uniref:Bifunctional apoptosis regulator-like isoform X1 n=1 Tax=Apteryx mantelli TaxID=2696672 RepID=A0ABM4FNP6_9AVES
MEMQRKKMETDRNVEGDGKLQKESDKSTETDSVSKRNLQVSGDDFPCSSCSAVLVTSNTLSSGDNTCQPCLSLWRMNSEANRTLECRPSEPGQEPGDPLQVSPMLHQAMETSSPNNTVERGMARKRSDTAHNVFHKHGNGQKVSQQWGWLFLGILTSLVTVSNILCIHLWIKNKHPVQDPLVHLKSLCPAESTSYSLANSSHKETFLMELKNLQLEKQHYSPWEYKTAKPKPTLFLLHALSTSPRLGILYIYYFDYTETFLPFIHTVCPVQEHGVDVHKKLSDLKPPTWKQWRRLLFKLTLAYQLVAEFAWSWLGIHYWTSWFLVINAMLLSLLELLSIWNLWSRKELQTIPCRACKHFWHVSTQGLLGAILWHFIPSFIWKYAFYWKLYCSPVINFHKIVKELRNLDL